MRRPKKSGGSEMRSDTSADDVGPYFLGIAAVVGDLSDIAQRMQKKRKEDDQGLSIYCNFFGCKREGESGQRNRKKNRNL